jgi:transcriptional regulator with XRE-family HTH domain
MKEKGETRGQLSVEAKIPYTTIVSFYEKGSENVKLSTLKKLAKHFNSSLDYLTDDSVIDKNNAPLKVQIEFDTDEIDLILKYRKLSDSIKFTLKEFVDFENLKMEK